MEHGANNLLEDNDGKRPYEVSTGTATGLLQDAEKVRDLRTNSRLSVILGPAALAPVVTPPPRNATRLQEKNAGEDGEEAAAPAPAPAAAEAAAAAPAEGEAAATEEAAAVETTEEAADAPKEEE